MKPIFIRNRYLAGVHLAGRSLYGFELQKGEKKIGEDEPYLQHPSLRCLLETQW